MWAERFVPRRWPRLPSVGQSGNKAVELVESKTGRSHCSPRRAVLGPGAHSSLLRCPCYCSMRVHQESPRTVRQAPQLPREIVG